MPETQPTNEHLVQLLEELLSEVHQLRDGQKQLVADVQELASTRG